MDVIKEKYVYVQGTFLKNVTTSYRTAHYSWAGTNYSRI